MQSLVDDLVDQAGGPLIIVASYTFGEYVLPGIIVDLQSTYPDIQHTLTIGNTSEIANLVGTHQLDVGIVEGHFNNQQLYVEEFAGDDMVVVAPARHELAQKESVDMHKLQNETWIVREKGSGTREATEDMYEFLPDNLMNFGSTQPIKGAVEAGLGVTLLSQWAIQKEVRNGDLSMVPVKGLPFSRQFSIITKTPFQTKALQVFIGLLRDNRMMTTFNK